MGHWRRYDAQAIVERLESVGLTDVEAQCYGGPVSFALDTVRQQVPKLYPHRDLGNHHEATMKSGQLLQPRGALAGRLMHLGSYPAVALARAFPGRGAGLIAVGRRPN